MTDPQHAAPRSPRQRRLTRFTAVAIAVVLVAVTVGAFAVYQKLNGNITALDTTEALGTDRPSAMPSSETEDRPPLNILLIGSDTREGQEGVGIGGDTPGLSDTTILLHLAADRSFAYSVSLPRDAMVERPDCVGKDGESEVAGGLAMFNSAYAVGGPACTQRTVEQLTGIRIDHFAVVDFSGFKTMVDALGGVPICVPEEVNDTIGNINLRAGSYEADGDEALDYVRLRHGLSENGDIGRMRRQQAFLAAMANKAISMDTLTNPVRLYNFLDAATKSLTTDEELASLKSLADLANQLRGIGLDKIAFLTVPFETYEPDPNRLVWAPRAKKLWRQIRNDEPLSGKQNERATTAAEDPSGGPGESPSAGPGESPSGTASPSAPDESATNAAENGLCA